MNFTDSCGRVCKITNPDSNSISSNDFDIFIVVDDKPFSFNIVPKSKKNVTITCGITTADCCSKYHFDHLHIFDKYIGFLFAKNWLHIVDDSSSSTLENTTHQTPQSESTPTSSDASQNVTNGTAGIRNVTRQITFSISKYETNNKRALTTYI